MFKETKTFSSHSNVIGKFFKQSIKHDWEVWKGRGNIDEMINKNTMFSFTWRCMN